jgi:hypothetical protein
MASYRVYYYDYLGKIFSADDIEASEDTDAIQRAASLVRVPVFEVWQRDRLVHRHPTSAEGRGDKPPQLERRSAG